MREVGEDGFAEESKDEEKRMRVVGEISERKKKKNAEWCYTALVPPGIVCVFLFDLLL